MASTLIQPKDRGANIDRLNPKQRMFVLEMLADVGMNANKAAKAAGYKHPHQAAARLLKDPAIKAMLGKEQKRVEDGVRLDRTKVLNYLDTLLFFNPLDYFKPTTDGTWLISDLDTLPPEIGCLIDGMKLKVIEKEGITETYFEVNFVSKAVAIGLAMKHFAVDKVEVKMPFDWDSLYGIEKKGIDDIEQKILDVGK